MRGVLQSKQELDLNSSQKELTRNTSADIRRQEKEAVRTHGSVVESRAVIREAMVRA